MTIEQKYQSGTPHVRFFFIEQRKNKAGDTLKIKFEPFFDWSFSIMAARAAAIKIDQSTFF